MDFLLGIIIGLMVGALFGFTTAALIEAAKEDDDD